MQSCNIATGAVCNYTNTTASVPTREISCSGVGLSQHICPVSKYCSQMQSIAPANSQLSFEANVTLCRKLIAVQPLQKAPQVKG